MISILMREEKTQKQRRKLKEDKDGDWSYASTSQKMPRATRS